MPLLNTATKVYKGTSLATKVYKGTVQVWPTVWTPAALNPHAWFDASNTASLTLTGGGTVVAKWNNLSGAGGHLFQNAGTPQRGGSSINGLPTIYFNGSSNFVSTSFTYVLTKPYTVLLVARSASTGAQRDVIMFKDDGRIYQTSSNLVSAYQGTTYSAGAWGTGARNVAVVFNDASSKFALDASTFTTVSLGTTNAVNDLWVGSNWSNVECWIGDVAEIVVVPGVMSDANLTLWRTYCNTKWGTP